MRLAVIYRGLYIMKEMEEKKREKKKKRERRKYKKRKSLAMYENMRGAPRDSWSIGRM